MRVVVLALLLLGQVFPAGMAAVVTGVFIHRILESLLELQTQVVVEVVALEFHREEAAQAVQVS
jgi:hypothetical protein